LIIVLYVEGTTPAKFAFPQMADSLQIGGFEEREREREIESQVFACPQKGHYQVVITQHKY